MKTEATILMLFLSPLLQGQSELPCAMSNSEKTWGPIANAAEYIPDENTPLVYVRGNIHFMLLEEGTQGYPGNFTETHDGLGNLGFTGYDFAKKLIEFANSQMSQNVQMNLPPNNMTAKPKKKVCWILNGVYFHRDNDS